MKVSGPFHPTYYVQPAHSRCQPTEQSCERCTKDYPCLKVPKAGTSHVDLLLALADADSWSTITKLARVWWRPWKLTLLCSSLLQSHEYTLFMQTPR